MRTLRLFLGAVVFTGAMSLTWFSCYAPEVVLYAQTLPVTRALAWDANPASDQITTYTVRLDTVVIGTPTSPTQAFTITTAGLHVLTVTATNLWGTSPPGTLTFTVKIPDTPSNLRFP